MKQTLRIFMLLAVAVLTAGQVWANAPVKYIDENGDEQEVTEYTVLTGSEPLNSNSEIELAEGTYVVNSSNLTYQHTIRLLGNTTLILADGANMTVEPAENNFGIYNGTSDASLTIYGQENQTGTLTVSGKGGDDAVYLGSLTINGGELTAYGMVDAYTTFTLNDGSLTVNKDAANNYASVYALGDVTINGGSLTINGGNAADTGNDLKGYNVYINGGMVTVTGDKYGIYADNDVTITGGTVNATATATSDHSRGINCERYFTMSGGKVTAIGQQYGICSYSTFTFGGGQLTVNVADGSTWADSYGIYLNNSVYHIYYSHASDFIKASSYKPNNVLFHKTNNSDGYILVNDANPTTELSGTHFESHAGFNDILAAMNGHKLTPKLCTVTLPDGVKAVGDGVKVAGNTVKAGVNLPVTLSVEKAPTGKTLGDFAAKDANDAAIAISENAFTMPNSNVTVTATWTLIDYSISNVSSEGAHGSVALYSDQTCNTPITTAVMDQTVYLKVTPDNGYELNGITAQATVPSIYAESRRSTPAPTTIPLDGQVAVTLVDGTTDVYQLTMPPANVEVAATFTPVVYSIAYDLGGGSVATDNPTSYTIESDPITLVNPTLEGYTFGGWTGSNVDTPQTEVTIVTGQTGNRNYKAVWYTEATVQVAWEDMDDHDGIRPVSVTATLSDGTEVTLSSSNSWTSTVTNLPAFDIEGQAIVYTWTESEVEGYELVGSTAEDGATTLTYSHTPTVTLTIGSGGWATYYHEDGLTYSVSDGAQAYYVSSIGNGVVNLTAIDVVPSGLPVLISGSGTVTLTAGATEVEVSGNDEQFKGTPTALEATDFTDFTVGRTYVLYKGVFLLADTNSGIGAHKCWLTLSGSNARQLNISIGETTGITPTPNPSRAGGEWYTLDGRKLSGEPTRKGLHIYNGKKVIK